MRTSERTREALGLLVVFGSGLGMVALHVVHVFRTDENFVTFLSGIFIPIILSLGLVAGGIWLWQSDVSGWAVLSVGCWCLVGSAVLGAGAMLIVVYQQAKGVVLDHTLFVVGDAVSIGSVAGFVVGIYDTRQRWAREAVAVERDRSSRLSRQLSVLNRILRHDIRNGANVISGRAELIAQNGRAEGEHVDAIRERADALAALGEHAKSIEQMLREETTERQTVDLAAVVESAGDRVQQSYDAVEAKVATPERARVTAHPLVDLAVEHVVENAVEHNDAECPYVEINASRLTRDGEAFVEVRVADDGPGIPAAEVNVLERGYETPLEHGSGLGLWIVNWIVTESGGGISFDENDPRGSVVTLRFEAESDAETS